MPKWLSTLLGSGAIGTLLGGLLRRFENARLSGKEREQNAFNAQQAELQRQFSTSEREASENFNAEQARQQMQFQESMANTQYQRGVADMRAAGVNPALAYSQGGSVAPSGAAAVSTPGSGAAASGSSQLQTLSDIMQFAKLGKEIERTDAEIRQFDAQTLLTQQNAEYRRQELSVFRPLSELQMKNLEADLNSKAVRARLDESDIKVNEADAALKTNQAMLAAIDEKTRAELNRLEIRQRVASVGYTHAQTSVAKKTLDRIDAEITELYQRAIEEAANAGRLDAETRNLLVQEGILCSESEDKAYRVKHKKLTFVLDCVGKTLGAVASAAGTFGAIGVGARSLGLVSSPLQQIHLSGSGLQYAPANSFNPYASPAFVAGLSR